MKIEAFNFRRRTKIEGTGVVHEISFDTHDITSCDNFFTPNLPDTLNVEIKKKARKRSLDANAYFWTLADKLASKLLTTKEEIYKQIIGRVGVFTYALVRSEDAENLVKDWQRNGIGWIAEKDMSPKTGYTQIRLYKGSSVYSTSEMSRLIDELVSECKEQGIETLTPDEKEELLQRWNAKT